MEHRRSSAGLETSLSDLTLKDVTIDNSIPEENPTIDEKTFLTDESDYFCDNLDIHCQQRIRKTTQALKQVS